MDDRYGYSLGVFDGSDLEKNLNMDIEERMRESLKNEEKREMLSLVLKSYGFEREIDDEMIEVFISLYKKVLEAFEELGEILKTWKGSEREMADISTLPTYEMNSFALWVAKLAEKYFENPDVKMRYEAWEKERARNEKNIRDFSCSNSGNASDGFTQE